MQCYFREQIQNPGVMGIPGQYNPMLNLTQPQLESLYPNTYHIIQPNVENMCNIMEAQHGNKYCPSHEEINRMVDQIYENVEGDVEAATKKNPGNTERQFIGGGRQVLRDLISILLISSLIRRRRPFYGFPGYFYGGYPPFGGYNYY